MVTILAAQSPPAPEISQRLVLPQPPSTRVTSVLLWAAASTGKKTLPVAPFQAPLPLSVCAKRRTAPVIPTLAARVISADGTDRQLLQRDARGLHQTAARARCQCCECAVLLQRLRPLQQRCRARPDPCTCVPAWVRAWACGCEQKECKGPTQPGLRVTVSCVKIVFLVPFSPNEAKPSSPARYAPPHHAAARRAPAASATSQAATPPHARRGDRRPAG